MGDLQGTYVPKDYQDLYEHYIQGNGSSLAQTLVRRFLPGETNEARQDILHDIYTRMQTKDVLKLYNPDKCNFGGVVFFVTRTVCVNYLKRKGHDPITNLCKASLEESSPGEDSIVTSFAPNPRGTKMGPGLGRRSGLGVMYLDKMESDDRGESGLVSAIDAERLVKILRADIDYVENARAGERAVRLHRLVDLLMEGNTIAECAKKEGVTVSTIYNWIDFLKSLVEGECQPR